MIRKALFIAVLIFAVISQHPASAQYAPTDQYEETTGMTLLQKPVTSQTGQGQVMTAVGKTLLNSGAELAFTGLACFVGGALMYDHDPEAPTMPVYPILGMAGAISGATVALIALPFYTAGKHKMETNGIDELSFTNENQTGGTSMIEFEYGLFHIISMDAVGGYNFNKNMFAGIGVGYKMLLFDDCGCDDYTSPVFLPIYATARYTFGNKKVAPYVGASLGYETQYKCMYTGMEFGTRFRKANANRGDSWWLGLKTEFMGDEEVTISVKLGRSF